MRFASVAIVALVLGGCGSVVPVPLTGAERLWCAERSQLVTETMARLSLITSLDGGDGQPIEGTDSVEAWYGFVDAYLNGEDRWHELGGLSVVPGSAAEDIDRACRAAFERAGKPSSGLHCPSGHRSVPAPARRHLSGSAADAFLRAWVSLPCCIAG